MPRLYGEKDMTRSTLSIAVCVACLGVAGAARTAAAGQDPAAAKTPPEITVQPLPPGPVFADANGYTLYVSDRDTEPGKSACTDACTKEWIPVRASTDAKAFD